MGCYLGIDTSNYTTSTALYDSETGRMMQQKQLLSVEAGQRGLRQSEALFQHTKQLPKLLRTLLEENTYTISGVGVSVRPRNLEGSYMPCFLAGESAATAAAAACGVPLYTCAHQDGHIAAALYSAGRTDLLFNSEFVAFHFSGGTTEGVFCQSDAQGLHTRIFSETSDLNAGQAVDRVGLMLGLRFPCGPALEQLAVQSTRKFSVHPAFAGDDPSISGVENQCRRMLERGEPPCDVAAYVLAYIQAVVEHMTDTAIRQFGTVPLIYAGGVMSNRIIAREIGSKYNGYFAEPSFSADNAAGVALLAAVRDGALHG